MRVGVDIGATNTCLAAELNGLPSETESFSTQNNFYATMMELLRRLQGMEMRLASPITELGVAVAGRLNTAQTHIVSAGNLTDWPGKPLADTVGFWYPKAKRRIGNDARAWALYEALNNPQLFDRDFLLFAVGTGIGTARVIWVDGKPIAIPMEAQHNALPRFYPFPNPVRCGCGVHNCIERLGSGSGAQQRFRKAAVDIPPGSWGLVALAQAAGLVTMLNNHLVELVVYAGGVPARQPQLMGLVQTALDRLLSGGPAVTLVEAKGSKPEAGRAGLALLAA
jgi:predicted NBD/HSP70 family sugar kinase